MTGAGGDYERSQHVAAAADALFDYLADVGNLPTYFSAMTSAEPAEGEAVKVTAVVDGNEHEAEAWFRVDHEHKHLEWGSEGPNNYQGHLDVAADGDGSRVSVALHTEDAHNDRIEQGLADTLAAIARLVAEGPAPDNT